MERCADARSSIYTAIAVLKKVEEPTLRGAVQLMGYNAYLEKYAVFAQTITEAEALDIGTYLPLAILVRELSAGNLRIILEPSSTLYVLL